MGAACLCVSCSAPAVKADGKVPDAEMRREVLMKLSAVVVADAANLDKWVRSGFSVKKGPKEADGGSAAPISPDGYFLTANHVLSHERGKKIFVLYGRNGRFVSAPGRIVWRSSAADVAILHAPIDTPRFYEWARGDRWMAYGTMVIHGGISTGPHSSPGRMTTALPPDGWASNHRFKMDIPLEPGDSGGPIVNAAGELVGLNSSVEYLVPMETPFFIESEGTRPDPRMIEELVKNDRIRNNRPAPAVAQP